MANEKSNIPAGCLFHEAFRRGLVRKGTVAEIPSSATKFNGLMFPQRSIPSDEVFVVNGKKEQVNRADELVEQMDELIGVGMHCWYCTIGCARQCFDTKAQATDGTIYILPLLQTMHLERPWQSE